MCKVLALSAHTNINKIEKFLDSKIFLQRGAFKNIEILIGETLSIKHDHIPLEEYDFVWLNSTWSTRTLAFTTMQYLQLKRVPHTNVEKSTSKLSDTIVCHQRGVRQPNTFFTPTNNLNGRFEEIQSKIKLPLIIKDVKGSLGANIFLIKNRTDFTKFLKEAPLKKQFLIQEYISNDFDWGINIANGEIIAASMRIRQDHPFLNNAHQGAKEVFVETQDVPEDVQREALLAMKALKLNWGRVDIVVNNEDKKPYVLEVNRRPGMTVNSPEVKAFAGFLQSKIGELNLI